MLNRGAMILALFFAASSAQGPALAQAQAVPGAIVIGPPGSTEARLGQDIAGLAAACGLSVDVRQTAGSVENMQAVRDRRHTQLGIVQGDVLEYYQTFQQDDPSLRRTAQGIRVVMPLGEAVVHVLARGDIAGLPDLAGRRVATGAPGSGTAVTADLVLDLAAVTPAERVALAPDAALAALRDGTVDAAFLVTGAPADLLAAPDLAAAGIHLLPLAQPALTAAYAPATVAAGTYPFVTADVPVVAVASLLVAFDFDPAANSYQAASCRLVADVSHLILTRLDTLRADGHPAWQGVNPATLPPGVQVSACALDGVDPNHAFTCRHPDGTTTGEGLATPADANALFMQRVCARLGC